MEENDVVLAKGERNVKLLKLSYQWMPILGILSIGLLFLIFLVHSALSSIELRSTLLAHPQATFGLPMAAILSLSLVGCLENNSGKIKFKGLGFEFEGASGQVVLWVMCLLAISLSIKMVW